MKTLNLKSIILLVAIIGITCTNKAIANPNQSTQLNNDNSNLPFDTNTILAVLAGGGVGGVGSRFLGKSQSIHQPLEDPSSGLSGTFPQTSDYKQSPQYMNEQINQLIEENKKLKQTMAQQTNALKRRFDYCERVLGQNNPDYIRYSDRRSSTETL